MFAMFRVSRNQRKGVLRLDVFAMFPCTPNRSVFTVFSDVRSPCASRNANPVVSVKTIPGL